MTFNHSGRWAAAFAGATLAVSAAPVAAQTRTFDIPAQAAAGGVAAFAEQAGLQIFVSESATAGRRTSAVRGSLSHAAALSALLRGSGLEVAANDGRTVTLRAARPQGAGLEALEPAIVDDVVVTGSLIRGAAPAGAHITVFDESAIRQTGVATVAEVVQTSPQNFRGAAQEASVLANQGGATGIGYSLGTSLNLRGIGADATLVLLNGRRMAPSGYGDFVDASAIPLGAVSRIEILADGASATYGSDALAGVVNVFLKTDFTGVQVDAQAGFGDGLDEQRAGVLLGTAGPAGFVMGGYEYYRRSDLLAIDRSYTASSDLRPFGGQDYRSPYSLPGNIVGPAAFAGAIPTGQDGRNLDPSQIQVGQTNLYDTRPVQRILPEQTRESVFLSGELQIDPRATLYVDALYSDRVSEFLNPPAANFLVVPSTNYYRQLNGFGGADPMFIMYNFAGDIGSLAARGQSRIYSASAGLRADLFRDWKIDAFAARGESRERSEQLYPDIFRPGSALEVALASSDPATAFNPFGDGGDNTAAVIASLTAPYLEATRSAYTSVNFKMDGSVLDLPGGAVRLAIGGEHRWETYDSRYAIDYRVGAPAGDGISGDRQASAVFGEVYLPLFTEANARPGLQRLEISASVRYDDYDDFGGTTNPKVGATWSPVAGLSLHGSWGTSFKAPRIRDLYQPQIAQLYPLTSAYGGPDTNGDGQTTLLLMMGGNPDLTAETGEAWTAGFNLAPKAWDGLTLNLTYFNLSFDDRIAQLPNLLAPINTPEAYLGSVYFLNPTPATVAAYLASASRVVNSLPVDTPVEGIILAGVANVSRAALDGLDFQASQSLETGLGRFTASANVTWYMNYTSQFSPSAPEVTVTDVVGYPVDLRGRFGLSWSQGGWSASAFANYMDDYLNNAVTPNRKIDSQTTADLQASYGFEDTGPAVLRGLTATISVNNVFDQDPPYAEYNQFAYDATNYSPVGRVVTLSLVKRW